MGKTNGNGYIWNAAAGLLNAGEAVILSMVVTRTNGLADAGILSIAFAIGNLMMAIGKFGVRNYQATDLEERFSFSDYFWTRVVTVSLMAISCFAYLWYCVQEKDYSSQKAAVILSICFIYATESVEDVFWGLYQQRQELDTGAKLFIFRWGVILTVFILVLIRCRDLKMASVFGAVAGLIAFCSYNLVVFQRFSEKIGKIWKASIFQVIKQCFPLFMVSFLSFYTMNAPKYAIDRYLPEEVQACYSFIAMPVFVIGLLNGFIYQPSLVQTALEWKNGRLEDFQKRVKRQCVIAAGLTIVCMAGAFLCGIPVMSMIYGTDLSGYKAQLLILLAGGGAYALAGYLSVLLTIMRRQRLIMYGYAGVAVLAACFSNLAVKYYNVMGAAVCFALLMLGLAVCFTVLYVKILRG